MSHARRKSSGSALLVLGTVVAAGLVLLAATREAQAETPAATCRLLEAGSENLPSATCRACHSWDGCHPVDVEYEVAVRRARIELRSHESAIRHGAFLPEGQVRCVSCHARHSAEPFHLAIRQPMRAEPAPTEGGDRADREGDLRPLCNECH